MLCRKWNYVFIHQSPKLWNWKERLPVHEVHISLWWCKCCLARLTGFICKPGLAILGILLIHSLIVITDAYHLTHVAKWCGRVRIFYSSLVMAHESKGMHLFVLGHSHCHTVSMATNTHPHTQRHLTSIQNFSQKLTDKRWGDFLADWLTDQATHRAADIFFNQIQLITYLAGTSHWKMEKVDLIHPEILKGSNSKICGSTHILLI